MNEALESEERFREFACNGDVDSMTALLQTSRIDVNSQNKINGWSALHWASKRNNLAALSFLLDQGADINLKNTNGDLPVDLTSNEDIKKALGGTDSGNFKESNLPITPNYLANPPFPYIQPSYQSYPSSKYNMEHTAAAKQNQKDNSVMSQLPPSFVPDENEVVLKVRLANSDERDFIEVELDRTKLTYEALLSLMCKELTVERRLVRKIRKLPDTVVRKDKDVKRLCDFQELELVLTNKAISASSRQYSGSNPVTDGLKDEQILY